MPLEEECFDVVDADDEVIGKRSRADVHRLGLRHRSVHLLVFNAKREVFLQKRSMGKDENPGQWDSSVSGHVDTGESYDECVIREALEEIGLALQKTPQRRLKLDAMPQTAMEFCQVYSTTSHGPFALDPVEVADGRWFAPDVLDAAVSRRDETFTPSFREIWARLGHRGRY